jgi:serine/threonine protein kinase
VATLLDVNNHKHVVAFHGLFWHTDSQGPRLSVVFECASHGDLLHKVLKYGTMTEITARPIFGGIVKGLAHIHSHGIVHRDVKAENILLKRDDLALLADFGLATWTSDEAQMARRAGSPGYVAPEICLGTPYCVKVDIFGIGVVLYFTLSKEMPFTSRDRDAATTMRKTVKCSLHLHRPPWDTMSSRLRNILRQMICRTAEERLSADGVLEHPWMQMSDKPKEPSSRVRAAERHEQRLEYEAGQDGNSEPVLPTLSRDKVIVPEDRPAWGQQQQHAEGFLPRLGPPAGSNGYPLGNGPNPPDIPTCGLSVGRRSRMPGSRRNSAV